MTTINLHENTFSIYYMCCPELPGPPRVNGKCERICLSATDDEFALVLLQNHHRDKIGKKKKKSKEYTFTHTWKTNTL